WAQLGRQIARKERARLTRGQANLPARRPDRKLKWFAVGDSTRQAPGGGDSFQAILTTISVPELLLHLAVVPIVGIAANGFVTRQHFSGNLRLLFHEVPQSRR